MKIAAAWCGLAAFGSGLILCAIAAGTGPLTAAALVVVALVEFAWGAVTLHAGRVRVPRAAMAVSAAVLLMTAGMLIGNAIGFLPFLSLFVLHWGAAVSAAFAHRGSRAGGGTTRVRPAVFVIAVTVQAMAVAAITTPALAATEPGEFAVPHGVEHHH